MSQCVDAMEPVTTPKEVHGNLDESLNPHLHSQCRGGVGQLQRLQTQGNPLIAYETSLLSAHAAASNGLNLVQLSKTMRTAKTYRDLYYNIVDMQDKLTWLILANASWANRLDGS